MSTGARRILANTAYRLLADVGSKLVSVVFYVVMARELGATGFGVFTFALAFVLLATTFGNFGQDSVLTREVARDPSLLDSYFFNTLAIKVVLSAASLAIAIGIASAAGVSAETRWAILLLAPAVVLELLMKTCFATFQSFERLEFIPVALITQRTITAVAGIAALVGGAGVLAVAAVYLGGAAVGFLLSIGLLWRYVARPAVEVDRRRWWSLMAGAAAIGLTSVFAVVLFRVDMTMLAAFKPAEVVGRYGAAYRLLEATLFVAWGVGAAVYPVFSRLTRTSDPPLSFVFERSLKLGIALTLPLATGAFVLADHLIRVLYGSDYAGATAALRLLAPTIALYPISYLAASLVVSQRKQLMMMILYGLVAAENILLNLVLIPAFSLNGAAIGTSISQLLVVIPLLVQARRVTGSVDWMRVAAGPVLATLASTAAMLALRGSFAAAVAAGTVVFVAVLVTFELRVYPDDARKVLAFFPWRRRFAG